MSGFGGRYPGGPRRRDGEDEAPERPHLEGVADFEERAARSVGRRRVERRARRTRIGFVVAVVVAGAVGLALGYRSHQTPQELAREQTRAQQEAASVSEEVNRVLLELWKMEDLERSGR